MNRSNAWLIALLTIHCIPNVQVPEATAKELLDDGMIFQSTDSGWATTKKAYAYIDALHQVPEPVQVWMVKA
jgi:hypothetical protein